MSMIVKVGDMIEAGPFMSNVSGEQITLVAVKCNEKKEIYHFDASLFGVHIGKAVLAVVEGRNVWTWA